MTFVRSAERCHKHLCDVVNTFRLRVIYSQMSTMGWLGWSKKCSFDFFYQMAINGAQVGAEISIQNSFLIWDEKSF